MKPTREVYAESYKGIQIEVSRHWNYEKREIWCFYLHLYVEMFQTEMQEDLWQPIKFSDFGTPMQPYADSLKPLNWHGGMTFYEKESAHDYPFKKIKVGCDYNHLWDQDRCYYAEEVMGEAKECVDSLFQLFPEIKSPESLWKKHRAKFKGDSK